MLKIICSPIHEGAPKHVRCKVFNWQPLCAVEDVGCPFKMYKYHTIKNNTNYFIIIISAFVFCPKSELEANELHRRVFCSVSALYSAGQSLLLWCFNLVHV